jgi:hypothetical protein
MPKKWQKTAFPKENIHSKTMLSINRANAQTNLRETKHAAIANI